MARSRSNFGPAEESTPKGETAAAVIETESSEQPAKAAKRRKRKSAATGDLSETAGIEECPRKTAMYVFGTAAALGLAAVIATYYATRTVVTGTPPGTP